MFQATGWVLEE
jgi:cation-transporting P-type ATPase 13A2